MAQKAKAIRVYLVNGSSIGTRCGWGEGRTHSEAIIAALKLAHQRDPNARYDDNTGTVQFSQSVYL